MRTIIAGIALFVCATQGMSATPSWAELKITYPTPNSTVSGEVIEITGTGADQNGALRVEVLTNKWWLQDGEARITPNGDWSYGPCNLGGQGQHNNHTIRVTVIKNGQPVSSASVAGIRRR